MQKYSKKSVMKKELNFTHILKKSAIQEMLSTFANIAGVSLCLCDKEGEILHSFIQETDDLYKVLVEEARVLRGILKEYRSTCGTVEEGDIIIIPGLNFILKKVVINNSEVAFVASGPIKESKPEKEALLSLIEKFNLKTDRLLKVISSRKVLKEQEVEKIRKFIISLAKVISEFCQQEFDAMENITRLSSLYNINNRLSTLLDPRAILQMSLEEAIKLLGAKQGFVMVLNEERDELRIASIYGIDDRELINSSIKIEDLGESAVILDGDARLFKNSGKEIYSFTGLKEDNPLICVTLKGRENLQGFMGITGKNFTRDDLHLLQILALSAAVAVDNASLYEKIQKKACELSTLFHIGNAINSTLDRDRVLQKVLDSAIMLLDAIQGSLMLLDQNTKEMRILAACGLPPEIMNTARVKLGEGISGKVALEGKPKLMKKGVKIEGSKKDMKDKKELKSAMCVPLKIKDKIMGVVNISDKKTNDNFTEEELELLLMMANQAATSIEKAGLHAELQELFISSIKALANAIDARDPYTRGHSERVTEYSVAMAESFGLEREEIESIRYAALLHDIGKINIPDHILNKPGKLTDEEFALMKKHPVFGAQIMKPVKAFQKILPYMFHHHERFGARGYPDGIKGETIPLPARIIAVADSFDAMTSDRPYRKALTLEAAVKELVDNSGSQFDPDVVKVFVKLIEENTFPYLTYEAVS